MQRSCAELLAHVPEEVSFTDRVRVQIRHVSSILLTVFVSKSATAYEFSKSPRSAGRPLLIAFKEINVTHR